MSTTPPSSPPDPESLRFSIAGQITVWDPIYRHLEIGTRTFWGGPERVGDPPGCGDQGHRHRAPGQPDRPRDRHDAQVRLTAGPVRAPDRHEPPPAERSSSTFGMTERVPA